MKYLASVTQPPAVALRNVFFYISKTFQMASTQVVIHFCLPFVGNKPDFLILPNFFLIRNISFAVVDDKYHSDPQVPRGGAESNVRKSPEFDE